MRTLASLVIGLVLTACEAGSTSVPVDLPPDEPPPVAPALAQELILPAKLASSHDVVLYAKLDGAQVTELTELSYGLTDSYPTQVTIAAQSGFILDHACQLETGAVLWRSIVDVQGTAATLALDGGRLAVELREEGTVSALLEGEIAGQHCTFGDEPTVTSVPLQHRVVLHVHRVAGFVVEQFHQRLADCWSSVVLPSDALLWPPTAHPLDAAGQRFEPINAPTPASITLRSYGALTLNNAAGQFTAGPGTVSVSVDTALPVQGLQSFEVVGPEALTSVEAGLYLQKAASKGSILERIEEGMSYRIFFPGMSNTVNIQVDSAMTAQGKLCANVPGAWFASASSTPDQCVASAGNIEALSAGVVSVATIRSDGECKLEVTVPGTNHKWTTKFSTAL